MSQKKTALLLIDIQNDNFPEGKVPLHQVEQAADNAAKLLAAFREKSLPVFHVRHEAAHPSVGFFLPGTTGAEIHEKVKPIQGEVVITKSEANSYKGTDLDTKLKEVGVENLVIGGSMTHMCIDAGVRASYDLGYKVTLAHDACATRDLQFGDRLVKAEDVHASFLAALSLGYAKVVSTEEALKELSA